jgi:hypothetical protein
MTKLSSSPPPAERDAGELRIAIAVGDGVRTPSGAVAEVIAIYPSEDEALVQWTTGDRARFKLGLLRALPT